jgi:hypothetical protein
VADPAELDRVCLREGFRLPDSYREFARTFGYGKLCDMYFVFIPIRGEESLSVRSEVLSDLLQQGLDEQLIDFRPHGSPELVARLVPFGNSDSGDILAWDPEDRPAPGEYAIYLIKPRFAGIVRAANDLYEFVAKCKEGRELAPLREREGGLRPVFRPRVPHDGPS